MNIEQFAAAHNIDKDALAGLIVYLQHNLTGTPEKVEAFRAATHSRRSELINQGVLAWIKHSREFLTELRDNQTPRAKLAREQIAADVWRIAREKKGLAL